MTKRTVVTVQLALIAVAVAVTMIVVFSVENGGGWAMAATFAGCAAAIIGALYASHRRNSERNERK